MAVFHYFQKGKKKCKHDRFTTTTCDEDNFKNISWTGLHKHKAEKTTTDN